MRKIILIGLSCAMLLTGLQGCTSVASVVADIATSTSSSTPSQVNTLADAIAVSTALTKAADIYVTSGVSISPATLREIQNLSNGLHDALGSLEAANAQGKSLNFAIFNAALAAYKAYATSAGISH